MTVRIWNNSYRHRLAGEWAPDPRLSVTVCGIRFLFDPVSCQRAESLLGSESVPGRCWKCWP